MKSRMIIVLFAGMAVGLLKTVAEEPAPFSRRQPYPPTSRPPATKTPGPKPSSPPDMIEKSVPDAEFPVHSPSTPSISHSPSDISGYIVFTAGALLFFRRPKNN